MAHDVRADRLRDDLDGASEEERSTLGGPSRDSRQAPLAPGEQEVEPCRDEGAKHVEVAMALEDLRGHGQVLIAPALEERRESIDEGDRDDLLHVARISLWGGLCIAA